MKSPFAFDGELGRCAYAAASAAALLVQSLFGIAVYAAAGQSTDLAWWIWPTPLRAVAREGHFAPWVLLLGMALVLLVDWLLAAFAFRRTKHIGALEQFAPFVVVPLLQIPVIVVLSLVPPVRRPAEEPRVARPSPRPKHAATVLGVLVGAAISVAATAFSTLVMGVYGYGLFIVSPFIIGLAAAYIGNRDRDLGIGGTSSLVAGALLLGGLALMSVALEGAICLVFASPLIFAVGLIGGLFGRAVAIRRPVRRAGTLMSVAILPFILAGERLVPPQSGFESVESIEVAASPAAVWDSVVHMGPIPGAPAPPFRWGLAYPMRGEIEGTGVGAVRRGVFSTGIAYERVTEWVPERKLSFIVLSDPPTMKEMSPYRHVNAPHVRGYFRTLDARFSITPLANGRTRLTLATRHELDLEPAVYWQPFAQWATHANKVRVLRHFRDQAETVGPTA